MKLIIALLLCLYITATFADVDGRGWDRRSSHHGGRPHPPPPPPPPPHRGCEGRDKYSCLNAPGCTYQRAISCCGQDVYYCAQGSQSNCTYGQVSCGIYNEEIVEFSSSCKPDNYKDYQAPSSQCPDGCSKCEWHEPQCGFTSCCPRVPVCLDGQSTHSSSSSSSSGSSSGWNHHGDLCRHVQCPRGFRCQVRDHRAKCIKKKEHIPPIHSDEFLCKTTKCPIGYSCKVYDGVANCVKGSNSVSSLCRGVKCPVGYECTVENDAPVCTKKGSSHHCPTCESYNCRALGLVCIMEASNCTVGRPCCPSTPRCISANTIGASTIASTASTVAGTSTTSTSTTASTTATSTSTTATSTTGTTTATSTTGTTEDTTTTTTGTTEDTTTTTTDDTTTTTTDDTTTTTTGTTEDTTTTTTAEATTDTTDEGTTEDTTTTTTGESDK